jgi:hypothetical protein
MGNLSQQAQKAYIESYVIGVSARIMVSSVYNNANILI